jgi:hypothetical protein
MDSFSIWHWLIILAIPGIIIGISIASWRIVKPGQAEPAGIGGWLGLLAMGIVPAPLFLIIRIALDWGKYEELLSLPGGLLAVSVEAVINVVCFVLLMAAAILMLRKSKKFPKLFFYLWLALPIMDIVDALLFIIVLNTEPRYIFTADAIATTAVSFVITGLWVLYLNKSVRARNTFIH